MWTKLRFICVQRKTLKFWISFGDNLWQAAKDAKRSEEITKNDSYRKNFRAVNRQYSQNNIQERLFYGMAVRWSKL